jgi:uncharacterized membrane protein (DUF106 family)
MLPFQELFLYSLGLSLLLALLYRFLTNPKELKRIKQELSYYREKVNSAQKVGNDAEVKRLSSEMMKASSAQFKASMKPMFASMIIFFFALGWFSTTFAELAVTLPFAIPFLGPTLNWFWWYLIITVPATMVFRKALGVE